MKIFKGICEICGISVKPSNKKWCSWECILKNYDVNEKGCWEWKGGLNAFGYGEVNRNGKIYLLHRYIYSNFRGKIKDKLCVLHTCDNRKCINPWHLFLGTKWDNSMDMIRKGRAKSCRGEENKKSKLTEIQVKEIRKMYKHRKMSSTELAKKYAITPQSIWAILKRRNWAHILEEE